MSVVFETPQDVIGKDGLDLGRTDWLLIDQDRIDKFADATGDHQWIHVDVKRAGAGPFGRTIAHGYLTLSLVNKFLPELIEIRTFAWGVNYGCNKVRFPAPVKVGARVRGHGELLSAEDLGGGVQTVVRMTVEVEGQDRPGCVAEILSRYYTESAA